MYWFDNLIYFDSITFVHLFTYIHVWWFYSNWHNCPFRYKKLIMECDYMSALYHSANNVLNIWLLHEDDPGCLLTHLLLDKMVAILVDGIFKCIFLDGNGWIPIQISLKFVPKRSVNNSQPLVHAMASTEQATSHYLNQWLLSLLTHICGTSGRWTR